MENGKENIFEAFGYKNSKSVGIVSIPKGTIPWLNGDGLEVNGTLLETSSDKQFVLASVVSKNKTTLKLAEELSPLQSDDANHLLHQEINKVVNSQGVSPKVVNASCNIFYAKGSRGVRPYFVDSSTTVNGVRTRMFILVGVCTKNQENKMISILCNGKGEKR